MSTSHDNRWNQAGSYGSLDNLARSTMSLDVPEARNCREAREQSRKEMHALNEKLASQLEKMRFLSEQNRKLMEETSGSRGRINKETEKLKKIYDAELRQLRQLVDDCEREKADSLAKMATVQQNLRYAEDQIKHLTHENKKISHQLDQVLKELSEKEADKQMLQRHLKAAEDEAKHIRQAAEQAKQNNEKLHANLDEETACRMACQSQMQTLREEMEFLKTVHEQELDELRNITFVDHHLDGDQWRDEMQKAIRDIQMEYDQRLEKIRNEIDTNYASRISEASRNNAAQSSYFSQLSEENNTLKEALEGIRKRLEQYRVKSEHYERVVTDAQEEIQTLRKKLDAASRDSNRERQAAEEALNRALNELSALTDAKLNLESEIAAYRRLLEAQDSLISGAKPSKVTTLDSSQVTYRPKELRVRVPLYNMWHTTGCAQNQSTKTDNTSLHRWTDRDEPSGQSIRSHLVERIIEGSQLLSCSYSNSEKLNSAQNENHSLGQLAFTECAQNGTYIEISNTGDSDVDLSGWCLIRNIDHGRSIIRYTFPDRRIPSHHTFRVWASGNGRHNTGFLDFEAPYSSWGTGNVVHTSLFSPHGKEKASHIQRVDYDI
ncbi:Neurofilament protein [Fasciolopsis buskii]|uniref:Neurofilament protein n=1 Tax=Fasciolopsis buskii TaxID=27845 RepID=A0A8E0S2Q9_9TREM|nr:Neurofilament protein [Fasciolopsis buski]